MLFPRALLLSALIALVSATPLASERADEHTRSKRFSDESMPSNPFHQTPPDLGMDRYASGDAGFPFNDFYPKPFFPFWPFISIPQIVPWYTGPNVCAETKHADEPEEFKELLQDLSRDTRSYEQSLHESCRGSNDFYVCRGSKMTNGKMKQYITKYSCCHGFVRNYYAPGCTESGNNVPHSRQGNSIHMEDSARYNYLSHVDVKDLMPALRDMGAIRFAELSEQAGLDDYLDTGNFTVFCPTNFAVDDFLKDLDEKENQIIPHIDKSEAQVNLSEVVSSHLARGFYRLDDFDDEKVLKAAKPGACIRINTYYTPHKVVTANCVPITSENNFARNGIIHRIERVLPIPSRTVADIVAADSQFSMLKSLLSRAGLVNFLRNPKGNFTLFAPTDAALASHASTLERLYNETQCVSSIMKNHILVHVICSSAIPRQAHSINMIGELLTLTWTADRKLYIDDVQVVVRDIIGTNGVVHIIDGVLIPGQAKSVIERLEESEIAEFTDLLELAELKPTFDEMKNVTFFVPDDESIRNTPPRILEDILRNREKLKDVLLYHVAIPQTETRDMKISQIYRTNLTGHNVRIGQYVTYPFLTKQATVQCARILSPDNRICGGVLHVIDRLLLPPKRNIVTALEDMAGFSTLLKILRETGLADRLKKDEETFTLLAPTDDAFHQMGSNIISQITQDRTKGTDFLKMHIISGTICCAQMRNIFDAGRQHIRSIDGSLLDIRISLRSVITVGEAKLVECDTSTENGVIHIIDRFVLHFKEEKNTAEQTNLLTGV